MSFKRILGGLCAVATAGLMFTGLLAPAKPVKADTTTNNVTVLSWDGTSVTPQIVDSVDNVQFPTTVRYWAWDDSKETYKFTLAKPSIVKVYYSWDAPSSNTRLSGTAWFSNDDKGANVIGTQLNLSKAGLSMYAYLDAGTYYVNQKFTIKDGNTSTSASIGLAMLVQPVDTNVTYTVTSFDMPNPIAVNTVYEGFLSQNSPHDYYVFRISSYGRVKIEYDFKTAGDNKPNQGICTLYDSDHRKLQQKNYNVGSSLQNNITEYLEPGLYFVELSNTTAPTYLKVGYQDYTVRASVQNSSAKYVNGTIPVRIYTDIDATEVLVIPGEYTASSMTDASIWSVQKGAVNVIDTMEYIAKESGYYSVRVKDGSQKYAMCTFYVKYIDKDAPVIEGVESGCTYTDQELTLTIVEDNIKKITIDGHSVPKNTSGIFFSAYDGNEIKLGYHNVYSLTSSGKTLVISNKKNSKWHKLKVVDAAGNETSVKFKVKFTKAYYYKEKKSGGSVAFTLKGENSKGEKIAKSYNVNSFIFTIDPTVLDKAPKLSSATKKALQAALVDELSIDDLASSEIGPDAVNAVLTKYFKKNVKGVIGVTATYSEED